MRGLERNGLPKGNSNQRRASAAGATPRNSTADKSGDTEVRALAILEAPGLLFPAYRATVLVSTFFSAQFERCGGKRRKRRPFRRAGLPWNLPARSDAAPITVDNARETDVAGRAESDCRSGNPDARTSTWHESVKQAVQLPIDPVCPSFQFCQTGHSCPTPPAQSAPLLMK